jgi:hypothetical protein
MPHKFTGQWRSFISPDGAPKAKKDGEMYVRLKLNGNVLTGSNHDGIDLTGVATLSPGGIHSLRLERSEPDNVRVYNGTLFSEEDTNGQKSMVIIGRYKDTAVPLPSKASKKSSKKLAGLGPAQNEGVWVITKP